MSLTVWLPGPMFILKRGVSVPGPMFHPGGLPPLCLGVSVSGGLYPGVSIQGSLSSRFLSMGSLFEGVSVQGSLSGGLYQGDPSYGEEQAVRILLKCFLVLVVLWIANSE